MCVCVQLEARRDRARMSATGACSPAIFAPASPTIRVASAPGLTPRLASAVARATAADNRYELTQRVTENDTPSSTSSPRGVRRPSPAISMRTPSATSRAPTAIAAALTLRAARSPSEIVAVVVGIERSDDVVVAAAPKKWIAVTVLEVGHGDTP